MPVIPVNGIRLSYDEAGTGDPVVMIQGTGGGRTVWQLHQVPALTAAGLRVITLDNRGIPPSSECPEGFTLQDMVGDVAGLIERLDLGPTAVVGTSMGAFVAQELALARPDLVSRAVLMATRGRTDFLRAELTRTEIDLCDSGVRLPDRYAAVLRALKSLSPRTLDDDSAMADWLDLFELTSVPGPGQRAQMEVSRLANRLAAYRGIRVPCQVVAFADDLVTPPRLGREVADAVPGARFDLVEGCGHYGYLEDPETVNKLLVQFLTGP
ncbi:alpha/beta hydrolase [Streptomyces olivaceus]|uniref:Alpha/beta hydrolase n=1 Tax=Streptomyces olivaceus TaxID=47716 RepID=A0ABS7WBX2_STROV|nr:alpha/beta fold hydrolase [Streptomyces olivaceus]MBZ6092771.1 alpha/beta hydrolase [Streptomyces olivaceus]MBZ6099644.1 alpha/beta hydrolase [Streptomyces olivaceus]MBZ6120475.1 alpha/beta hydrolase [Streptomyces olivaceus]MBZ6155453.1 alpha/beta hydrolase [Streptomyces olivaceus]MBZ6203938.1 alpha/beta hydrolase [Streptomyces olivaceus]